MSDQPETHAVTVARHQLREVADAYEALAERVLNGPDPHVQHDQQRGPVDDELDPDAVGLDGRPLGPVVGATAPSPSPAYMPAVHARHRIDQWATWIARAVMDYRDAEYESLAAAAERLQPGPARDAALAMAEAAKPWAPRSVDAPSILREVADAHLGVFLGDPLAAAEFLESCLAAVKVARRAAWPTGARWVRLHVPCSESDTSDAGERVPCPGEYRMWMRPGQDALGDMVCDKDGTHRITPSEWQRAMRRKPMNVEAAARFARELRLAGGKVAS